MQYSLATAQERGVLFIGAGAKVYKGQVIGQNSRGEDISVNVCKEKQLTNHRSKGDGVTAHADISKHMTLEDSLEYISDDELVEITPENIRIRKVILDEQAARRAAKGLTA
jgi:GTP-binding protein